MDYQLKPTDLILSGDTKVMAVKAGIKRSVYPYLIKPSAITDGFNDQWDLWDNEGGAYDGDTETMASCLKTPDDKYPYGDDIYLLPIPSSSLSWFWTSYLDFTFNSPISCDKLKFHAWYNTLHCNRIDIDAFYPGYQEGILAGQTGL